MRQAVELLILLMACAACFAVGLFGRSWIDQQPDRSKPFADSGIENSGVLPPIKQTTVPRYMRIMGSGTVLVEIDLETGNASMAGDPNEAAKVFWDAVGTERRKR